MADIVPANVSAVKIAELQQPNVVGELAERGATKWRSVLVKVTVATNTDYNATTGIPLDNLFDSTKTSYLGLVQATCKSEYVGVYHGTLFAPGYVDWANKKLNLYSVNAAGANPQMMQNVNVTGLGTGTIELKVFGQVA